MGVIFSGAVTLLFWFGATFFLAFLARFCQGAASAATWTAGLALIAEHYVENRVQMMGFALAGSTAGSVLGPMMVYSGESNLKRVTVETGGKSPQIITAQVPDLDVAVGYAINGIYGNKGEMCSAGSRILVDANIRDEFVERFRAKVAATVRVGDPLDPTTTMGPLVSRSQQQKVVSYIDIGKKEGAELVLGGSAPEGPGSYVAPTLFTGVNNEMQIAKEEIFGPVGAVLSFSTVDEAVKIANDSIFGLAAGIWTSDVTTAHKMARALMRV